MATITYIKGPLGYAVLLDGKPYGSIKDYRPHGWQVRIPALKKGPLFQGTTVFKNIRAAQGAVLNSVRKSLCSS